MHPCSSPSVPSFRGRIRERIAQVGSSLCVGADPHMDKLPKFFAHCVATEGTEAFLMRFSQTLIEASAGQVAAIKFQSAFYEAHGALGFAVLTRALALARAHGLITILDAKRGDIASTMAAYGQMAFDTMAADALTIMPYMGMDSVAPLLPWLTKGHGVYVVWISSNPSGALIQDAAAEPLLDALFEYVSEAGVSDALGLVLGATKVEPLPLALLQRLRLTSLLMPGIGAQGGMVTARIRELIASTGTVLVPQSRSLTAYPEGVSSWAQYQDVVSLRIQEAKLQLHP